MGVVGSFTSLELMTGHMHSRSMLPEEIREGQGDGGKIGTCCLDKV